jgi:CubicO group peptidase (beta-lactamase class C family)
MNMKHKPAFLLTLLFATIIFAPAAVSAERVKSPDSSVKSRIDSLLASFPQDGAGGIVAVVEKGELLYEGSYGFAHAEWRIPNSMDACFRIGSVTKTFTALAVLQLAETGKLSLDDKATKWFPDVDMDGRITLAHLLSHTSGLLSGTSKPEFVPGEKMNYSNYAYILLGKLIEKVSGSTYEQYLHDHIFYPLGMQQTGYDHYRDIIPNRAAGYEMLNGKMVNLGFTDIEGAGGAGALYSSGADMVRFAQELSQNRVLPAQLMAASMKPFTLNNGDASSYGMGWMTRTYRGWREVSHGGDIDGFNCYFAHFPDRQITVMVLQNMKMQMNTDWANGGRLVHRLVDLIWDGEFAPSAPLLPTVTIPVEVLQWLTGTYAFENAPAEMIAAMGASISFFVEDGHLMVRDKTGTARLKALSESEFVLPGIDIRIKFQAGNGIHPPGLNLVLLSVRDLYAKRVE